MIELSIFNFSLNFTGPDLQLFLAFKLSQSMLDMHQKAANQAKIDQDLMKMVSIILEGL